MNRFTRSMALGVMLLAPSAAPGAEPHTAGTKPVFTYPIGAEGGPKDRRRAEDSEGPNGWLRGVSLGFLFLG